MNLKEYAKIINELVKNGKGNKEVWYSSDNEGNGYEMVHYAPSVQHLDVAGKDVIVIN